ncbi:hypothetical protein WN51_08989 [Melipona quadrifasciata]|uniref:Uncharacterized protein n=1 Tax=Melipona quadrifasciata TaxID=166423 RepID=A0A0M9A9N8_9HYME|nr:hypothetical protein WN51_08989 [Melipona quadrifasciata]
MLTLDLGLRRPYTWKFTVAQVQQPIIDADFLQYHGLLVDLRNRRIIDDYTKLQQLAQISTNNFQSITTLERPYAERPRRLAPDIFKVAREEFQLLIQMLGFRNSYKEDIQATAAEMVYGTPLRLPGEFFIDNEI